MKTIFTFLTLTCITLVYSQEKFVFSEEGLVPEFITTTIENTTSTNLYNKALEWVEKHDLVIETQQENDYISLKAIKNNVIREGKNYYHLSFSVKISFKEGLYKFEPLIMQTKLNSKYDMGWKDFDFKNGDLLFKKGKLIKKLKSYAIDIPTQLNDMNNSLYNYLMVK